MIPTNSSLTSSNLVEIQQPSRTWKLSFTNGRIEGMTDGVEAVRQAVFKALQTERFYYLIYNSDFGHELNSVIGKSGSYAESEIKRCIREALLQDDRINDVTNIEISIIGDQATVRFQVHSIYGVFQEEVIRNV